MTAAPPLRLLFWESTRRCNLACIHCRREDPAVPAEPELTTDQMRGVLDDLPRMGRPIVVFSGGEPLLREDWQELADHAAGLHLPTALATNGTLIDGELAGRIAAAGFHRVSISLDGADPATHDAFRGVDGAFASALAGADRLRQRGVRLQVNVTVAAHNAGQLDDIARRARELSAEALHLFLLVPVGCGLEIADSHRLSPQRAEEVLRWACRAAGRDGLEIKATCAPHVLRVADHLGRPSPGGGCLAGRAVVFLSSTGRVQPCGYLPIRAGSVRHRTLSAIWSQSPLLARLRQSGLLEGACGQCDFAPTCRGCRARALAATGRLFAPDPACLHATSNGGLPRKTPR